jgi:aldehyde:ferredoxin oxidoreductase
MEAYEKKVINETDCGGFPLKWGNAEGMLEMVRQIGEKNGLGAILGLGVKKAAQILGDNSEEYAIHVKGLELPAHDPRAFFSSALSYATSNRGACHLAGFTHGLEGSFTVPELGYERIQDRFAVEGKGEMVAKMQNLMGLYDSLKICKFVIFGDITVTDLLNCLNNVTGWDMTLAEFLQTGERMFNLKRMYNVHCGISRKDDMLPYRIMTSPRNEGGAKGKLPHLGKMLNEYYNYRGWNEEGLPTVEKLAELELTWLLEQ